MILGVGLPNDFIYFFFSFFLSFSIDFFYLLAPLLRSSIPFGTTSVTLRTASKSQCNTP